jgi:hypothetical protein
LAAVSEGRAAARSALATIRVSLADQPGDLPEPALRRRKGVVRIDYLRN